MMHLSELPSVFIDATERGKRNINQFFDYLLRHIPVTMFSSSRKKRLVLDTVRCKSTLNKYNNYF